MCRLNKFIGFLLLGALCLSLLGLFAAEKRLNECEIKIKEISHSLEICEKDNSELQESIDKAFPEVSIMVIR